jgi:hypothetical protein
MLFINVCSISHPPVWVVFSSRKHNIFKLLSLLFKALFILYFFKGYHFSKTKRNLGKKLLGYRAHTVKQLADYNGC